MPDERFSLNNLTKPNIVPIILPYRYWLGLDDDVLDPISRMHFDKIHSLCKKQDVLSLKERGMLEYRDAGYLLDDTLHWNETGHRVVAEELYPVIKRAL